MALVTSGCRQSYAPMEESLATPAEGGDGFPEEIPSDMEGVFEAGAQTATAQAVAGAVRQDRLDALGGHRAKALVEEGAVGAVGPVLPGLAAEGVVAQGGAGSVFHVGDSGLAAAHSVVGRVHPVT